MNVTEAVATRRSVRQFLDKPVPLDVLQRVLTTAQASPSGGNTQPWNAVILTGQPLAELTAKVKAKAATAPLGEAPEYDIYPKGLEGRYEEQRRGVGKALTGRERGPEKGIAVERRLVGAVLHVADELAQRGPEDLRVDLFVLFSGWKDNQIRAFA